MLNTLKLLEKKKKESQQNKQNKILFYFIYPLFSQESLFEMQDLFF